MIFIGGISQGQKILDYVKTVICDRCGGYGRYQVYMTYMYFSFFFIPLFKWNKKFYVKMSCCGTVYELDPEVGKALLHGQQADIKSSDLTLVQEGRRRGYYDSGTYKTWKKCGYCHPILTAGWMPNCSRRKKEETRQAKMMDWAGRYPGR